MWRKLLMPRGTTRAAWEAGRTLQLMQNASAHLLAGPPCQKHVAPSLQHPHVSPAGVRVQAEVLVLTEKALHTEGIACSLSPRRSPCRYHPRATAPW